MGEAVDINTASQRCQEVVDRIREAVIVEHEFIENIVTTILADGHVLLEDVPGTGKTLTGLMIAEALDLDFSRIQFTPDLLPSDITGSHVFNRETGEFSFTPGPIFANIVLADEINRAPPKTQAALLEAMDEGQVTVEGDTHKLPEPFFVIATQNPVEQEGTFALPEAQRDRFMMKLSMGYPDRDGELQLIENRSQRNTKMPTIDPVVAGDEVPSLKAVAERVEMSDDVREYLVDLARYSRDDRRAEIGVSPRGIQRYFEAARARAVLRGREFVVPDDVKQLAGPIMEHRIVLTTESQIEGESGADIVKSILAAIDVPAVRPES